MEYRYIGKTGCRVSVISLGSYLSFGQNDDETVAHECMTKAYDLGINFFDTAESYDNGKSELMIGRVLSKKNWKRNSYLIATKLFFGGKGINDIGLSRKHLLEGIEASLNRLQISYVDFLYCHRPDSYTDIEQTVRAMTHIINHGKALYWGTSQWTLKQIKTAVKIANQKNLIPPTIEQIPHNLLLRFYLDKISKYTNKTGIGVITHSPLFSGLLTGKYHLDDDYLLDQGRIFKTDGDRGEMNLIRNFFFQHKIKENLKSGLLQVKKLADELSCNISQLLIAWVISHPSICSVLLGCSNAEQLLNNAQAVKIYKNLNYTHIKKLNNIGNKIMLCNLLSEPKLTLKTFLRATNVDYRPVE